MKRQWFQDADGGYYRTCPLIMREIDHAAARLWLLHRLPGLRAEWRRTFAVGVTRKATLGRGDQYGGKPAPMRQAYPDHPGLWVLDAPEPAGDAREGTHG